MLVPVMNRILPLTVVAYLLIPIVSSWPQVPAQPPNGAQTQGSNPDQSSPDKNSQTKSAEKPPAQAPVQPAGAAPSPAAPPVAGAPSQVKPEEKQPAQAPAPETPPAAKPQEKVEKALQASEEEKKKTVSEAEESAAGIVKGRLELELTLTYASLSSNQLFIEGFGILPILIVGETQVQRIRRDSFIETFATRYKITSDLQAELRIPYQITTIRVSTAQGITGRNAVATNVETFSSGHGLGDVNGTLTYHLLNEKIEQPSVYAGLGFKGRTGRDTFETQDPVKNPPIGSGFNSINFSLNATKTSDPAVVYGSIIYGYSLPRHNVVFKRPNGQPPLLVGFFPGNSVSFGFGMAYALNYKLTINMGYQQSINLPTRISGIGLPNNKLPNSVTNAASFRLGALWRVSEKTVIDLSISPGLTLDAPDVQVALRIPYRF